MPSPPAGCQKPQGGVERPQSLRLLLVQAGFTGFAGHCFCLRNPFLATSDDRWLTEAASPNKVASPLFLTRCAGEARHTPSPPMLAVQQSRMGPPALLQQGLGVGLRLFQRLGDVHATGNDILHHDFDHFGSQLEGGLERIGGHVGGGGVIIRAGHHG